MSDTANPGGVPGPKLFPVLDQLADPSSSQKLSGRPAAAMPSTVPHHIASITDGFSFAYLKETYIASLLTLVQYSAKEDMPAETEDDRKWGRFGNLLQQQVATLREDILKWGEDGTVKMYDEKNEKEEDWCYLMNSGHRAGEGDVQERKTDSNESTYEYVSWHSGLGCKRVGYPL